MTSLSTLHLVILAVGALVVFLPPLLKHRLFPPFLAVVVFISSLGLALDWWGRPVLTWLAPIQIHRSSIFIALGVAAGGLAMVHVGRRASAKPSAQAVVFAAIGLLAGLLRIVHENPVSGYSSLAFTAATIFPLAFYLASVLHGDAEWYSAIRSVVFGGLLFAGASAVQAVIRTDVLMLGQGHRFIGMTGNPQHAATMLAIVLTCVLWLLLNDPFRRYRLLWLGAAAVMTPMLLLTGSRTGLLMLVLGSTAVMYARIGRAILLLPPAALAAYGVFRVVAAFAGSDVVSRLVSTQDTRSTRWAQLIDTGLKNPLFGMGLDEAAASENSLLLAFGAYGIGMVALVLVLMLVSAVQSVKLIRLRWRIDPTGRAFIDLILGFYAMYFVGSLLEGYVLARVAPALVCMLIFAAISTRLLSLYAAPSTAWDEAEQDEYASEWDGAPETA